MAALAVCFLYPMLFVSYAQPVSLAAHTKEKITPRDTRSLYPLSKILTSKAYSKLFVSVIEDFNKQGIKAAHTKTNSCPFGANLLGTFKRNQQGIRVVIFSFEGRILCEAFIFSFASGPSKTNSFQIEDKYQE